MKNWKTGGLLAGYLLFSMSLLYSRGQPQHVVDWPVYGGSPGSMRYSSLKEINQSNVTHLQVAGNATPATYEIDGRQYIVIAASGGGVLHNQRNTRAPQQGASYIAFALPGGSK